MTLGRYASGLLRGEMAPLGAIRGQVETRVLGTRAVRLLPVLHPAAALYRREPNLRLLEEDFARIPALLEQGPPEQPERMEPVPEFDAPDEAPELEAGAEPVAAPADEATPEAEPPTAAATPREEQLGLF